MSDAVDVLAVSPHPDDVELSVGGLLLKEKDRGRRTGILDLTRGELSTRGDPETRAREAAEAARLLGVDVRRQLGLPDGGVTADDASRRKAVAALRALRPTVILTPHETDLHPDHAAAARLVAEASFLAGVGKYEPSAGPPHRARVVLRYAAHRQFEPSVVVDVSDVFERKRRACLAYRSQFFDPASKEPETYISGERFWAWWEGRARHYGNLVGAAYGEPLLLDGPVRLDDVVGAFADYGYYPKTSSR